MMMIDLFGLVLLLSFLVAFGWGSWSLTRSVSALLGSHRQQRQLARQARRDAAEGQASWKRLIAESGGYGPAEPVEGYIVYVPQKTANSRQGQVVFSTEKYIWVKNNWFVSGMPEDASPLSESYEATLPLDQLSERWCEYCFMVAEQLNRPRYERFVQGVIVEQKEHDDEQQAAQAVDALPSASTVTGGLASSEIPRV